MKANIYEQRTPIQSAGKERTKTGEQVEFFHSNFHKVGELEGSYSSVWIEAKKLTKCPILEWI